MTLSAGSRLGPYEIVALLGAGGMGEVYRRLHWLGDLPLAPSFGRRLLLPGVCLRGWIGHRVAARPDADSTAPLVAELRSGSRGAIRFARLLRETRSHREPS